MTLVRRGGNPPAREKETSPDETTHLLVWQSWSASNLYNLYQRTYGPPTSETNFTKSSKTLFQQKWKAKQLVRAYHGDWLQEQKFKKHYLVKNLPPIVAPSSSSSSSSGTASSAGAAAPPRRFNQQNNASESKVPLASMMFSKLERRLDTVIFRCCFAHSVYRARQMVIHGNVKLNGKRVRAAQRQHHVRQQALLTFLLDRSRTQTSCSHQET